mmetsp:Transcript_82248/g.145728  ORF Transcript_82248/g.145728 Transcript_82248/m.145728 type:complete len:458 (-) Transcript_82248:88-1461(-)
MSISTVRAAFLIVLWSSAAAANVTQEGEKEITASAPVIIKLEQQTKLIEHGTGKKNFYSAVLAVGGPKPQQFRVGFDLGGGTTLLPSKECKSNGCNERKVYDKCDSNMAEDVMRDGKLVIPGTPKICKRRKSFLARDVGTLEFHSVELGDGKAKGNFVRDKVCIDVQGDETRCFPFAFLAASIMTDDPFVAEPYDGIVGLGPGTGGVLSNDFDFLYRIIHSVPGNTQGMFGLYLGPNNGGEIAFGGYDAKRLNSPISWAPVADVDEGRWQVTISAIRVGNSTLDVCSGTRCLAAFDHGTSYLGVPASMGEQMGKQISAAGPKHCEESKVPDLQLDLNGITLTVPVQDYSPSTATMPIKDGPCLPTMEVHGMDASLSPGNHLFILGESVLRRYYTIYDQDSNRIGFSLAKEDEDRPKKLRLKSGMSEAMPSSKDSNYVVLVQIKVSSRKTRSTLLEHA